MKIFIHFCSRGSLHKLLIFSLLFSLISCKESENKKLEESSSETGIKPPSEEPKKDQSRLYSENHDTLMMQLNDFLPSDYSALEIARGDLNLDKYPDVLLVLKKKDEENSSGGADNPGKRPVLIYVGQPDKTYRLMAKNDNAVLCADCGGALGDPFRKIVIKNGNFSIELSGGSSWAWTRIITFKYSQPDNYWFLHKDGKESFHRSDPQKSETKIYTAKNFGVVPFDKFDVYKEN